MSSSLDAYVVTFNCGRELVNSEFFAAHLFKGRTNRSTPPDLIVLCLQEVAPIAYSFISPRLTAKYTNLFESAVKSAVRTDYGAEFASDLQLSQLRNVGMTAIMVFARRQVVERLERVDIAGTGVGMWDMGNKGAVGVRLWIEQEQGESIPVTFVAAHLAPMEDGWERRNTDWQSICETLVFTSQDPSRGSEASTGPEDEPLLSKSSNAAEVHEHGMFTPTSQVFFAGDLNYRTSDLKPHPDDHKDWPQPHEVDRFATMLQADQLTREQAAGRTLHLLNEAMITFPPTYKYSSDAQKQAQKIASGAVQPQNLWAKHRIPSWCDRILFSEDSGMKVQSYIALPVQPTSDHRPVALSVTIPMKQMSTSADPPFSINPNWRARRAQARRLELVVGMLAYLSLTREGETILLCSATAIFCAVMGYQYFIG